VNYAGLSWGRPNPVARADCGVRGAECLKQETCLSPLLRLRRLH
jgi:hypothetical protein